MLRAAAVALAAGFGLTAPLPAEAAFTYTLTVEGPGSVRITGTGTLDLTGLTFKERTGSDLSLVIGHLGIIYQSSGQFDVYEGLTGPANFGFDSSDPIFAADASGDNVGLFGQLQLIVPAGYVSGTPLTAMILVNKPLIAIGSQGDYVYTWAGDTFTVKVPAEPGPFEVPEPAAALLLGAGILGLGAVRRRR
jgi:hypothetical protein